MMEVEILKKGTASHTAAKESSRKHVEFLGLLSATMQADKAVYVISIFLLFLVELLGFMYSLILDCKLFNL
ncbi:hypothetical protein Sjap_002666 [Stephania japonica]|uniref:Uncharacterized protein n=1 Tax=Stephania japonica TaxID=461633 RepID=A0AAP0PWB9_9MAGN